jgi:hypothetical protein
MSQISLSSASVFPGERAADEIPDPAARTNWTATGASANAAMKHPLVLVASAANPQNKATLVTSNPPWKPRLPLCNVWRDGFKWIVVRFCGTQF